MENSFLWDKRIGNREQNIICVSGMMHKNNINIVGSCICESTECFNVNSAGRSPVMVDDVFSQPQRG